MTRCAHWWDTPENHCTEPADYVQGVMAECGHAAGETTRHCREHAEYWANHVCYCSACDAPSRFTEPVYIGATP